MSVDYSLIGARIKKARKAYGITQDILAEKLSVSVGYVSQIERGITKINLDMLSKLSNELSCDLTYFLTGVNDTHAHYLSDELNLALSDMSEKQKRVLLELCEVVMKNID